MEITNCTRCGKLMNDTRLKIVLNVTADRKTNSDTWEGIANMCIQSNEVLCSDCFDIFVGSIDEAMNK